jgi:hypothetical protein
VSGSELGLDRPTEGGSAEGAMTSNSELGFASGGSGAAARATQSELGARAGSQSEQQPASKVESDRLFRKFQRVYQDHVAAKESWGGYVCPPDCSYCREFRVVAEWRVAWEDRV